MSEYRRLEFRPLGHPHWPRFYRYEVAGRRFRLGWNRYPFSRIGAFVVIGYWAYCVKWGTPARYELVRQGA